MLPVYPIRVSLVDAIPTKVMQVVRFECVYSGPGCAYHILVSGNCEFEAAIVSVGVAFYDR